MAAPTVRRLPAPPITSAAIVPGRGRIHGRQAANENKNSYRHSEKRPIDLEFGEVDALGGEKGGQSDQDGDYGEKNEDRIRQRSGRAGSTSIAISHWRSFCDLSRRQQWRLINRKMEEKREGEWNL